MVSDFTFLGLGVDQFARLASPTFGMPNYSRFLLGWVAKMVSFMKVAVLVPLQLILISDATVQRGFYPLIPFWLWLRRRFFGYINCSMFCNGNLTGVLLLNYSTFVRLGGCHD